jgi:tetratricopeptide (TPR) repeat protein
LKTLTPLWTRPLVALDAVHFYLAKLVSPADLAVDYALGVALIRLGQIERGEAVIDPILKAGNTAEANLLLGEAQFAAQDYKAAAGSLQKAVALNPKLAVSRSLPHESRAAQPGALASPISGSIGNRPRTGTRSRSFFRACLGMAARAAWPGACISLAR